MSSDRPQSDAPHADEAAHTNMRYWAFLSYSHSDRVFAARLHGELEAYRVPEDIAGRASRDGTVPPRIRPVFRDRDELEAAAHLSDTIRAAIAASRYMIVICSPRSARSRHVNEEIRLFKAMGRGERVLSLIVDGEPCTDDDPRHCFPTALTRRVNGAGELTDDIVEPIAADARRQGDGWNDAVLKIIAGVLGVRLDDLRRREARRRRAVVRRRAFLSLCGLALAGAAGVAACDAGLNLPLGGPIRRGLDTRGLSVFRRPRSRAQVISSAAAQRLHLSRSLVSNQSPSGMFWQLLGMPTGPQDDSWLSAQVTSAIFRDADADNRSFQAGKRCLDAMVSPAFLYDYAGGPSVWINPAISPRGLALLWMVGGIAVGYRREALFTAAEREHLIECLRRLEPAMLRLRTDVSGGWSMFPNLADPTKHDTYSTCLALNALLELRQSGLPFDGGAAQRDEHIRATAAWLVQSFRPDSVPPGWRLYAIDPFPQNYDGLTLQVYCSLLRAHEEGLSTIPQDILAAMVRHIISCGERPADFPVTTGEFAINVMEEGKEKEQKEGITFLWHPWAIEACVRWLRWNETTHGAAPAHVVAVRRTLGHLVVDLRNANQAQYFVQAAEAFRAAEYLAGLGSVESLPPYQ